MPRVVIIGAGIVGCALADETTERGVRQVVVLEKGPLWAAGGSTSHAPGLVFQTNSSRTLALFAKYTVEKLCSLKLDGEPCFLQVGSLEVATRPERLTELHRRASFAKAWGIEARVISPKEAGALHPVLDHSKILGALYVPTDGIAKAIRADEAMGKCAMKRGAKFLERHEVLGIEQKNGQVTGVTTDQGFFPADIVISCAGIWGPKIGDMVGMPKALQPLAHQLAYTSTLPSLANHTEEASIPILRNQAEDLYYRQRGTGMGVGWYGHRPLPVSSQDLLAYDDSEIMPSQLPFTALEWKGAIERSLEILPDLAQTDVIEGMNGIFSFTVDTFPLMGEWSGLKGFWVAEAVWVTHAAGVARAIAEWIVDGHSSLSVHECDVNRFEPHQLSPEYISQRGAQNYVEVYDLIHPLQPMSEPRALRTTGFFPRQQELGGVFLEASGYERPQWFESNAHLVEKYPSPPRDAWTSKFWSPIIGAEAQTVRNGVGLFDITSLKRIEVSGKGAFEFLMHQTTGNLNKRTGSITYCLMLSRAGGILSDITVTRLGETHFMIGANGNADLARLLTAAPDTVHVRDVTAGTIGLGLFGPQARALAQSLCKNDLSNESLGYFRAKRTHLGQVPVTLCRLSYVGELGYEIYTSADLGLKLWDTLWAAGRAYDLIAAGRGAFNSMRLEKGYRSFGTDMTSEHGPYEAGLAFSVRKGGGFIGAEAFSALDPTTIRRKLVCLVLSQPEHVLMGKEPVLAAGKPVGYVTSSYFGHTLGKQIAYAWVPTDLSALGTLLEVGYFDQLYPAVVSHDPQFDANMSRLRS